ncbi:MAG: exodeoxyribonuclease III [Rhodospirillaceae bacterium]|nr:exodeoxyribonuclease III [Rhodospirillaceae bacterium]|tara:strand:- start:946 stop:1740 length:795 start_codon:yes stop_codon:yes gene_type:complete
MKITTWNINSVRLRASLVTKLLKDVQPDVLCLQETKCPDELFPYQSFYDIGYRHIAVHGMKGYNGVALVSRLPFKNEQRLDWVDKSDCRHISATFPKNIELHNFYVPAGGDEPDIEKNEKFAHKLEFLKEVKEWFISERQSADPIILVGDLNIAPLESDVWSHKQLLNVVSHTPVEVQHLNNLMNSLDWTDAIRHLIPEPEKLYTWWSYRARDWAVSNRGRRLDHIWVTPPLLENIAGSSISKTARGWEKPSDHVPVTTELSIR